MDIRIVLKKSVWLTFFITLLLFAFVSIVVSSYGLVTQERFEKALTVTSGYFSGIATLIAAYIASNLFNDWRDQHNKTIFSKEALSIFKSLEEYKIKVVDYSESIHNTDNFAKKFNIPYQTIYQKDIVLSDLFRELIILEKKYTIDTNVLLGITKGTPSSESPDSIGIKDAKEYFKKYCSFIRTSYIRTDGVIDDQLIERTKIFEVNFLAKTNLIQENLKKYIVVDTKHNDE